MPEDIQKGSRTLAGARAAERNNGRARIPYLLIAVVFAPLAGAYAGMLRNVEGFRFAHPWFLALIPLVVALVLWLGLGRRAERRALFLHSRAGELAAQRPGMVARLRDLPTVLRLAAAVLLIVALARPQSTRASDDLEVEGIDIVIALDLSGSMQETDLVPNRLEAAKTVIQDFVRRRPTDRIGLVVFGREAYTYAPMTLDHGALLRMVGELRLDRRRQRHRDRRRRRCRAQPPVRRGPAPDERGGQGGCAGDGGGRQAGGGEDAGARRTLEGADRSHRR